MSVLDKLPMSVSNTILKFCSIFGLWRNAVENHGALSSLVHAVLFGLLGFGLASWLN